MYTSVIDENKTRSLKSAAGFLVISIAAALFGAVYERFSHEVYSYFMIYAFAIPLLGGALPYLLLGLSKRGRYPGALCRSLWHAGLATLTVGSIMRGVLEIYGTTNSLSNIYWFVGVPLAVTAGVDFAVRR